MKKILMAHDGSKSSEKALKKALQVAETFGSSLTVLSVIPELYLTELMALDRARILDTMTKETRGMMEKIKAKSKHLKSLKTVIRQGDPADEILKTAEKIKADVIITGSHGRHGAQRFLLGSVSSKIVDHAECDVLVVKK
ncbi:Universal stress protein [Candidatus Sulfobium mesophilum]|uniref:Universal stress protein n=1 Tax=Candidatus Sulfobium mesophilum TaxID=2016548 RepID=A0A2U3QIZ5_9BACT|nr:Universal stress protein [Candidatus Sulfobium mesophilum]